MIPYKNENHCHKALAHNASSCDSAEGHSHSHDHEQSSSEGSGSASAPTNPDKSTVVESYRKMAT